jgi:hypothetical protein
MTVQEIEHLIQDHDTGFWRDNVTKWTHLQYVSVDGRIILKCIFKKWDGEAWIGLLWLRIGTSGCRLWMRLRAPWRWSEYRSKHVGAF